MNYGLDENDRFYIDVPGCRYEPGNMKEESDRRALELGSLYTNIWIANSGGIDSQSMIVSLKKGGVPFESAFMWHKGVNDVELEQVKLVDKKNNINTHIIELDPEDYKEEILADSEKYDLHPNSILQMVFASKLPSDATIVSMSHDPFVNMIEKEGKYIPLFAQGYYSPEISVDRAAKAYGRSEKTVFYGDTSEMIYSILTDDIFQSCLNAWKYFKDNGLSKPGVKLDTVDRWDYYIKPLIYGKLWTQDELIFFTKNTGFQHYDWLSVKGKGYSTRTNYTKLDKFIEYLLADKNKIRRYYQNLTDSKFDYDAKPSELIV